MANQLQVTLEIGSHGKRVVAVAADWPGLERGASTEEAAIERLQSYRSRYAPVAKLAGMEAEFAGVSTIDVVERYPGTGSTDYWGVSFAFSALDQQALSRAELERELTLMRASWAFFDEVRARVSAQMRKGPRGGGRDRDVIVRHTLGAEQDMSAKVGARMPANTPLTTEHVQAYREAYCDAIRAYHAEGKLARKWPLRYLIRHTAYHTLDHAWEMQDKDLTAEGR